MRTTCRPFAIATFPILLLVACGQNLPTAPAVSQPPTAPSPTPSSSGTYTLTFVASSTCNRDWWGPDLALSRTYQATLPGVSAYVYLSGATFANDYFGLTGAHGVLNGISVSIAGDRIRLSMEDPPIAEVDVSGRIVEIYGHAEGTLTNPVTELAFFGDYADCFAPDHRLILRRTGP